MDKFKEVKSQEGINSDIKGSELNSGLNMRELLSICLHYWYWFAISIVACVFLAWVQYKKSAPVYQREAMIQLVHPDGSTQGNASGAIFSALGVNQANPEKQAEMIIIKSPSVMDEVVRRLHLNVSYTVPGGWYRQTLYGRNLPFIVSFPGSHDETLISLETEIQPDGIVEIKSIKGHLHNEKEVEMSNLDIKVDYKASQTIKTSLGEINFSANPIYDEAPISEPYEIDINKGSIYWTAINLSNGVATSVPDEWAEIISLTYSDVVPERASDIIDMVIQVYNDQWASDRESIAEQTSKFIDERIQRIGSELEGVESDIAAYKSAHLLTDQASMANSLLSQAAKVSDEILDLNNKLTMTKYIRDFISAASNSHELLPSNAGIGNVNIESQISKYNELMIARNRVVSNSSETNPIVIDYDTQLEAQRRALLQSLNNAIAMLQQTMANAQQSEQRTAGRLAANPTQTQRLLSTERKQKVAESLYLFLMQKREESELSQKFITFRVRIVTPPVGSPAPISPKRNMMLLIGLVVGILIPLAVIYLSELFNNRVRTRRDIEGLTIPYLGHLPDISPTKSRLKKKLSRNDLSGSSSIVVEHDKLNQINEAFRMVRTNLELMTRHRQGDPAFTLAITALNPSSGKTFISMNLAQTLAIKGHKVLLIDLDLRRASLSENLNCSPEINTVNRVKGLVDYLINPTDQPIEEIIVSGIHDNPNLDLISVGAIPPNPSELVAGPAFDNLIEGLKGQYDYIIFDCPPVEIVADTLIVNKLVDMTLFIVRAGLFNRNFLPMVQEMYDSDRYRSMAVILNAANEHRVYGYGYTDGRYSYYYGKKSKGGKHKKH